MQIAPSTLLNTSYIQVHAVVAREYKNIIEDYNLMAADEELDKSIDEDMNEEPDI